MNDFDLTRRAVTPEIPVAIEVRTLLRRHGLKIPANDRQKFLNVPGPAGKACGFEFLELGLGMPLLNFFKNVDKTLCLDRSETCASTSHSQVVH